MNSYLQTFIQRLSFRGFTKNTVSTYKSYLNTYLTYLNGLQLDPKDATWDIIRGFIDDIQKQRGLSDATINLIISIIQFFHIYVLRKHWDKDEVPFRKFDHYLPYVPSPDDVTVLLNALRDNPKAYLAVCVLYATGMRLDELCHLRCGDIRRREHRIYISKCKNRYDRYIPLTDSVRDMIIGYWLSLPEDKRSDEWIFTQQKNTGKPMDKQWIQNALIKARRQCNLNEKFTCHSLRHAYATRSYENGLSLLELQQFLGHRSINSTTIYIHLACVQRTEVPNPLDQLMERGNHND